MNSWRSGPEGRSGTGGVGLRHQESNRRLAVPVAGFRSLFRWRPRWVGCFSVPPHGPKKCSMSWGPRSLIHLIQDTLISVLISVCSRSCLRSRQLDSIRPHHPANARLSASQRQIKLPVSVFSALLPWSVCFPNREIKTHVNRSRTSSFKFGRMSSKSTVRSGTFSPTP